MHGGLANLRSALLDRGRPMNATPYVVIAAVAAAATCGCTSPSVAGRACIVLDLRNPDQCGARQDVGGLRVEEVGSGHQATTDGDGRFRVDLPEDAAGAVLRVAADRADRRTSLIGVPDAPAEDVLAPVITTVLWSTYLAALGVTEDPSRATLHVSFPPPGVFLGGAQVAGATQILYNQGEPFVWGPQPPADQTIGFLALGVPADAGAAMVHVVSISDQVLHSAAEPVEPGAITWVQVKL
jgi:hypothetical protein